MKKWLFTILFSTVITLLCVFIGTHFLPIYIPDIYNTVPEWMKYFIVLEIFFTFAVIFYAQNALYPQLRKAEKTFTKGDIAPEQCEETVRDIQYDKRAFIADYFDVNIQENRNISGIQASNFINEEDILKSFTHISMLNSLPMVVTSAGLCCTFIAILLGLGSVHIATDGNIQGITGLINNLSGKFSTSIAAMILAIIANIYSSYLFSAIHKAFLKIEQTIDSCFQVKNLAESGMLQNLTQGIASQFMKGFNEFQMAVSGEEFQRRMAENRNLISEVNALINNVGGYAQNLAGITQHIAAANNSLAVFNGNMDKLANISDSLNKISTALTLDNKTLSENYNMVAQQLPEMANKFAEVCHNMRGHLSENYRGSLEAAMQDVLNAHIEQLKHNFGGGVAPIAFTPQPQFKPAETVSPAVASFAFRQTQNEPPAFNKPAAAAPITPSVQKDIQESKPVTAPAPSLDDFEQEDPTQLSPAIKEQLAQAPAKNRENQAEEKTEKEGFLKTIFGKFMGK